MKTLFLIHNFNKTALFCAALASAFAIGKVQAQAVNFDNTGSWDGSTSIDSWGTGGTATYGETFVAPSVGSVTLNDFTFYLHELDAASSTITYEAAIYAWSGDVATGGTGVATGSALFSVNLSLTGDVDTFDAVTVNTGGVTLTPGANYVALFTTSDPYSLAQNGTTSATFDWGMVNSSVANDGGGTLVWYNNQTSSQLTDGETWDGSPNGVGGGALVWKADFNAVPEPSTLALISLGVAGLFVSRRKANQ
jgi:hypothetical protein